MLSLFNETVTFLSTFVAPIDVGMGDLFISLPVIQALIDAGEEVYLVTRSFRQNTLSNRIIGIKGEIAEADLDLGPHDRLINLRAHRLQTDHNWASPDFEQFFGMPRIEKIIEKIATDFGIVVDYQRLTRLEFKPISSMQNTILFVPASDGFYKHWPTANWLAIASALKSAGIKTAVLGEANHSKALEELVAAGLEWIPTATTDDAIDVISNCLALVSVDTGLMHIGVQQGVQTIAFINPRNIHHRSATNCTIFEGNACSTECRLPNVLKPDHAATNKLNVELKFNREYCKLPPAENCMAAITPHMVLEKIRENLLQSKTE